MNPKAGGFTDILLLGMGGSSLCPEVLARKPSAASRDSPSSTCSIPPIPRRSRLSRARLISRKPCSWFPANRDRRWSRISSNNTSSSERMQTVGADKAGSHFIAITDPGSKMQQVAEARPLSPYLLRRAQYRRALFCALQLRHGAGGAHGAGCWEISRPHAANGRSLRPLRRRSRRTPESCWASILGTAATNGRDKVTIITSPGHLRPRRMARATAGRIDGQTWAKVLFR